MHISAVRNVSYGGRNVSKQVHKIINRAMGQDVKVAIGNSSLTIKIPGRSGSIIVEDCGAFGRPSDPLALAKDFSIVRNAINQGIVKPKHVTKIGL